MASLQSLAPITTTATALSNIILVTPQTVVGYQPQNSGTIGVTQYSESSLLFHYEGEQSVVIENDITDHYIENNTAIQDQISQRPDIITTHGFIGELNDVAPFGSTIIQNIQSRLTAIAAYTPQLTIDALLAYNEAFLAYQIAANAVTSAVSTWASLPGNPQGAQSVIGNNGLLKGNKLAQNRQQTIFQQFYGYKSQNTLFTVQTPWCVFQNCAILRLRAIQDAETNQISDFEVSFKRLRFAAAVTTGDVNPNLSDSPLQQQSSAASTNSSTPPQSSTSFSTLNGNFA